jgi:ubiquitin-conjugating enzyme E2 Q
MRGHLRFIDKAEDLIPQLQHMKQFVMHCSKPETEAKFQNLADDATIKLAFHGSPIQKWHSIVRRGLNFSKTSHGRSFGNGIYFATNALTSLGYMGGGGLVVNGAAVLDRWWNSIFTAKFQCLAVCEGLVLPDICSHLVASSLYVIAQDTVLINRG